ncbi:YitT family protein [Mycoplasmopsis meleagridis]|uniref:YitT family protein n=1 Tax=Mycoplasmopsis meleagridis TaxID=29561 RepID=UPI0009ECAAD0|nr:YitT family protein [Mycoplasmopsis meleagridis]
MKNVSQKGQKFVNFFKQNKKPNNLNLDPNYDPDNEKWEPFRICDVDINMTEMGQYNFRKLNSKNKEVKKQNIKLWSKRVILVFLAALIFNFGVNAFLAKANTIPSGFTGIPTLTVLLVKPHWSDINKLFALIYVIVNIPLFIIVGLQFEKTKSFFRVKLKIKKSFLLMSLGFMFSQIVTNAIFTYEPVNHFITSTFNVAPGWKETIEVVENGVKIVAENPVTWPIFINGLIGSMFLGVAIAMAWKSGGSTGGSDFIAYFFTTKKKKSVSSILMAVSFTSSLIFLVIYSIVDPHKPAVMIKGYLDNGNPIYVINHEAKTIVGMREFSTIFYIFIANGLVGLLYPKYKKVGIEISCADPSKVIAYFRAIEYWHAYTITKATSGYTGKEIYKIETTILLLESRSLLRDLKIIDKTLWIRVKNINNVIGNFKTSFVE